MTEEQIQPILNNGFRFWMIGRCMKSLGCQRDKAEDIVQNVYLNLWRTDRFDPNKGSVTTYAGWWLRSVISSLLDRESRRIRTCHLSGKVISHYGADTTQVVQDRLDTESTMQKVVEFADIALTPLQKTSVFETFIEGKPLGEVSEQAGNTRTWPKQTQKGIRSRMISLTLRPGRHWFK